MLVGHPTLVAGRVVSNPNPVQFNNKSRKEQTLIFAETNCSFLFLETMIPASFSLEIRLFSKGNEKYPNLTVNTIITMNKNYLNPHPPSFFLSL